jgi:hypothetical protein
MTRFTQSVGEKAFFIQAELAVSRERLPPVGPLQGK